MNRIAAVTVVALMGVGSIAFAQDLAYASEGRLSIHSVGDTITQIDHVDGIQYADTYQVTADHTLTLVSRHAI